MTVESFRTTSPNGSLEARVTMTEGDPKAVLLCLHGGPGGDLTGNSGIFDDLADLAKNLTCATVQFSFFGSGESDGDQKDISIEKHLEDYAHMVGETRARFNCPIHVVGESAGCTIASRAWLDFAASYIMLWPAFDLSDSDLREYLSEDHYEQARRDGFVKDGSLTMSFDLIEELRTLDFEGAFRLPSRKDFFIAHGKADVEVPYAQSLRALQYATGRVQFFGHPFADHGFKDPEHRADLLLQMKAWLTLTV
ncbi:alpha/beta fold hydrolase [uncultured Litoreibacter sp.]|uniref:alpha/beta hydrolase n=1 Tax=uncultured Litoreibacter sp. TaxID=1392394 RepID=UPI00260E265F|nr:alpha/beta fold hydrolase [uncultured Litoreibacter sp.]